MQILFRILRTFIRFLVVWFVDAVSLLVTAWLIPGISLLPQSGSSTFVVAVAASLLLGIVNLLVRPLILMLALPLGWIVLFLAGFFINADHAHDHFRPDAQAFEVSGWGAAFFGGLFLSLVNTILSDSAELRQRSIVSTPTWSCARVSLCQTNCLKMPDVVW